MVVKHSFQKREPPYTILKQVIICRYYFFDKYSSFKPWKVEHCRNDYVYTYFEWGNFSSFSPGSRLVYQASLRKINEWLQNLVQWKHCITLHVLRMFPEPIWRWLLHFKTRIDHFFQIYLNYFNLLTPCFHLKVIHTETNIQLSAAGLFRYVWPFSGHQALKS